MKPVQNSGPRRETREGGKDGRDKGDERKERLVLLAIAVLLVANVVLYLCHHYGLTSLNDRRPHADQARVILD